MPRTILCFQCTHHRLSVVRRPSYQVEFPSRKTRHLQVVAALLADAAAAAAAAAAGTKAFAFVVAQRFDQIGSNSSINCLITVIGVRGDLSATIPSLLLVVPERTCAS